MIAAAELFRGQALDGRCPAVVAGVARDSRRVRRGEAFVAQADTAAHAAEARTRGAAVVIGGAHHPDADLLTPHPRWCFARASAAAHGLDRICPPIAAVTGTKGKTTVVHLLWSLLGPGAARIGTVGWHDGCSERPNPQTTPPPDELHAFLAGLPTSCPGVAIEASSHGADQHRLAGLRLAALAVTGIGHDHLDYHRSPAAYLQAKLRSIRLLTTGARCVINAEDAHAGLFLRAARAVDAEAMPLGADRLERGTDGGWRLDGDALPVALPGSFNAWNAAAAVLLAEALGISRSLALARLATAEPPPGRLELLARAPLTYVDYAHTPESIANLLAALREAHPGRRLALVFGCGGERDASKRAPMGAAAAAADAVVVTSDNARSEDPAAIAAQVLAGLVDHPCTEVMADRGAAIRRARALAGANGVVAVAGKGHETTQSIRGELRPWSDRDFVRSLDPQP